MFSVFRASPERSTIPRQFILGEGQRGGLVAAVAVVEKPKGHGEMVERALKTECFKFAPPVPSRRPFAIGTQSEHSLHLPLPLEPRYNSGDVEPRQPAQGRILPSD